MKLAACLLLVLTLSACDTSTPIDDAGDVAVTLDAPDPIDASDAPDVVLDAGPIDPRCGAFDRVDGEAYTQCGATSCTLLGEDPNNCGECGHVCPTDGAALNPWERCIAGACR